METPNVKTEESLRRQWENRPMHLRILGFEEWRSQRAGATEPIHAPVAAAEVRQRHSSGEMNRLETRYAEHLEMQKRAGEIQAWEFEAVKLRLAKSTFLSIDFLVVVASGAVELHEVKGHWEDDARVKVKVAARLFPWWTIYDVQWDKAAKDWKFEVIHG